MVLLALLGAFVIAAVLVAAGMSFFLRRHGETGAPAVDWTATDEVFRDPASNRLMRVWTDGTGERHYVPERGGRSAP